MTRTPGASTPGLSSPGRSTPGEQTPDNAFGADLSATSEDVDIASTGQKTALTVDAIEGKVEEVTVETAVSDVTIQIALFSLSGMPLTIFDSPISPSGTGEETFSVSPSEDAAFFRGNPGFFGVEVVSASSTGGAVADVTVKVQSEDVRNVDEGSFAPPGP